MMKRTIAISIVFTLFVIALFYGVFTWDNKYTTPPPYGEYGVIALTEQDISRPIFLIDGWELTDADGNTQYTYIGEHSNLQCGNPHALPHGTGCYSLTFDYVGEAKEVMVYFPALFFDYEISLNGKSLSQGQGSSRISFTLAEGEHTLMVKTNSTTGYYSGLYHPPVLGTAETISTMIAQQVLLYTLACFVSLALALFTFPLWLQRKNPFALWFGGLCVSYSLYLSYFFVRQFGLPFGEYWYLVQSLSFYGLCFCVLKLAIHTCGKKTKYQTWIQWGMLGFSANLVLLSLFDTTIALHGQLSDIYCLTMFCSVMWLTLSTKPRNGEQLFTKLACIAFCGGLLYNLFIANLFEPIYTFWHFEWCGLLLVGLFACGMVNGHRRMLAENETYQTSLETMVAERTHELNTILQERKAFFADMAHDLKAPVYATTFFIEAIRANATGVDGELLHYIELVEQKQQEMAHRVQGLNEFNRMDGLSGVSQLISLSDFLKRIQNSYEMTAEVKMVHLNIEPLTQDGTLYAPQDKLDILFENLIFNALKFTEPEGSITLSATADEEGCHFTLSDTGCGIALEEIPRLFDRFYVGAKGKEKGGSGLGLYIVKSIVDSLGGEISLSSKEGNGTVFFIDLPRKP